MIKTRTNLSEETDYHRNMVAVLKHDRSIINVYVILLSDTSKEQYLTYILFEVIFRKVKALVCSMLPVHNDVYLCQNTAETIMNKYVTLIISNIYIIGSIRKNKIMCCV